jgi:hypothetical protein
MILLVGAGLGEGSLGPMGRKLLHKQLRFTKDVIRTLIESMLSLSIQHEQIYLFDLTQFKDLSLLMQLKLRKRTITTTPH